MTVDELIKKLNQLKKDKEIHGEDLCLVYTDPSGVFTEDLDCIIKSANEGTVILTY